MLKNVKENMINQAVSEAKTKAENEMKTALDSIEQEKEKAVRKLNLLWLIYQFKLHLNLISKNLIVITGGLLIKQLMKLVKHNESE